MVQNDFYHFPILYAFVKYSRKVFFVGILDLINEHHPILKCSFQKYFLVLDENRLEIRMEKNRLILLSRGSNPKRNFKESSLSSCRSNSRQDYIEISEETKLSLMFFPTIYPCEKGFFTGIYTKNKYRK